MSLVICPKCQYRIPGEHSHCPECHRQLDGTEHRTGETPPVVKEHHVKGLQCPHCGSDKIHPARGLEGFKEYLTVSSFFILCLALGWVIPALVIVPIGVYYLYTRTCPHCLNCDRRLHRLLGHLSQTVRKT